MRVAQRAPLALFLSLSRTIRTSSLCKPKCVLGEWETINDDLSRTPGQSFLGQPRCEKQDCDENPKKEVLNFSELTIKVVSMWWAECANCEFPLLARRHDKFFETVGSLFGEKIRTKNTKSTSHYITHHSEREILILPIIHHQQKSFSLISFFIVSSPWSC